METSANHPKPYNYAPLDKLLNFYKPEEIAHQLDEAMSDLVNSSDHNEGYGSSLAERHNLLRELRNVFTKLARHADQ